VSRPSKPRSRATSKTSPARRRKKSSRASRRSAGSASSIPLPGAWREFLHALISTRTRFLVVGAHAVSVHGEPRLTENLDVFVESSAANAKRLQSAFERFGFGTLAPSIETLAAPDRVFMLGRKPSRIDVLTSISGVDFATAWRGRLSVAFDSKRLPIIGLAELIANKRATGRLKDLADVEALERLGARKQHKR
jgi:hypothetical protein